MKMSKMVVVTIFILTTFCIPLVCSAGYGGITKVDWKIPDEMNVVVPKGCLLLDTCRLDELKVSPPADITHVEIFPTAGKECSVVSGGYLKLVEANTKIFFRLIASVLGPGRCNFSRGDYAWITNSYQVVPEREVAEICRNNQGKPVTVAKHLEVYLCDKYPCEGDHMVADKTVRATLNCEHLSCSPLTNSNQQIELEGMASSQFEYDFQYVIAGGVDPQSGTVATRTYKLASGKIPNGLSLSTAGQLRGSPRDAGKFDFTVKVTNDCKYGNQEVQIPSCLKVKCAPLESDPLSELPSAHGGSPYSVDLKKLVTNGYVPLAFSITKGTLPEGLNLYPQTGVISGTPPSKPYISGVQAPTGSTSTFTIKVSDSCSLGSRSIEKEFILKVIQPIKKLEPPKPVMPSVPTGPFPPKGK